MKIQSYAVCSALFVSKFLLPVGAETLDSLAEFGNAANSNATSEAGTPRGANFSGSAAGTYTITAGGTDFWGGSDNGSFIYDADQSRAADENFSVIVRSVSIAGNDVESLAGEWGRTGIMARKTPDAANSAAVAHIRKSGGDPNGGDPPDTLLQGRSNDGGETDRGPGENGEHRNFVENTLNGSSVRNTPIWLGLHRFEGQWYSTWAPDNGGTPGEWSASIQRAGSPHTTGEVWVGLAHQSHNINPIVNTAVFEGFSVGEFDSDLGAFPTAASGDLVLSGAGVALTASGSELGSADPLDIDWEVRYFGSDVMTPGFLNADIYLAGNGGNIGAFDTLIANQAPNGSTQIDQIRWAANTYTTTNAAGVNLFAAAVPGSFGGDQNDYGINLTGEIHIPSDADRAGKETVSFHDGVDDFAHLVIDGAVLIDDNSWSNLDGTANGGGAMGTLDVSDPKYDDGEWVSFRMVTWEGGGGDDVNLVWDALDRTGSDSVTTGADNLKDTYLAEGLTDGAQVNLFNDPSDAIPAVNFRVPSPAILNTISGSGQPNGLVLDALPAGTLSVEVFANGALMLTAPTIVNVASADFTASNVFTMVLADAGTGGGIADVDSTSLSATLDGVAVTVAIAKVDGLTTLIYTFPTPPIPFTDHTFAVTGTTTAETGGEDVELSVTRRSLPLLVELRAGLSAPPNSTVGWDYMEFSVLDTLGVDLGGGEQGFIDAQTVISTALAPTAEAQQPYINHSDPDTNTVSGDWAPDLPVLIDNVGADDNQYVTYARTTITLSAEQTGNYTFRITGDDGYGLRVNGASFTSVAGSNVNKLDPRDPSVVYFPDFTGNSNAFAVCNFPTAGDYLVEFFGFEGGGGAFQEISWVKGAFTNLNQSSNWTLLGDTSALVSVSRLWGELSEAILPPIPAGGEAGWSTLIYYDAAVGNLGNTLNFLRDVADPAQAVATVLPALNHADDGGDAGRFNPSEPFPGDTNGGDTNNIAMIARAFVVAPTAGDYTLQVRSDDGFLLRFANPENTFSSLNGAGSLRGTARNEVFFQDGTGDSNTRATVNLAAGEHELIFVWWEGGGGAHFEISAAPGVVPSQDGPYELLSTTVSATNLFLGGGKSEELTITQISYDQVNDQFSLTFNSRDRTTYAIFADTDLNGFETEVTDGVEGDGSPVTFGPFLSPFQGAPKVFFRVQVVE